MSLAIRPSVLCCSCRPFWKAMLPPRGRIARKWPMNCSSAAVFSSSALIR